VSLTDTSGGSPSAPATPAPPGTQYLRKVQLYVANDKQGLDLSQMHFTFSIKQWTTQTPNICEIRVWNLANDTAQQIQKEFTQLVLNAGYEGTGVNTIFNGNIVQVRRGREDPADTYTDITCLDGDIAYTWGIVSLTLNSGKDMRQRMDAIAQSMGLKIGYIGSLPPHAQVLPRGSTLFGMARDHMTAQAKAGNMNWSIQNGELEIVAFDSYKPLEAVELNSKTGLIGYPEQTQDGIRVKCLLNSKLEVNCLIKITNPEFIRELEVQVTPETEIQNAAPNRPAINDAGQYRILVLEHTGDTRGNQYYSDMICISAAPDQIIPSQALKGYVPRNFS
jgi:hypothetical protein